MDDPENDPRQPTGAAAAYLVLALVVGLGGMLLGAALAAVWIKVFGL